MRKLIIIGNGFDLDHELPTTYSHFKLHIRDRFSLEEDDITYQDIPYIIDNSNGGYYFDESEAVNFIFNILQSVNSPNWSDFEESLCMMDFSEYIDDSLYVLDEDDITNPWQTSTNFEVFKN